ncbi:MAG: hypothetical protein H6725_06310 [Sandaracinaceae bacterium]|nr:hypothetical protein [Sandaracinaceae bacterium]
MLPARVVGSSSVPSTMPLYTHSSVAPQGLLRVEGFSLPALAVCFVLGALACTPEDHERPRDGFPERLDRLAPDLAELPSYEPAFPLWTNGADKRRFVQTPDGTPAHPGAIPVGTLFFKQFAYDGVVIETRVIRVGESGPEYAVYVHEDGSALGARRMAPDGVREVPVVFEGETFSHVIPHETQCAACHEAGMGPVLGFTAPQLAVHEPEQDEDDDERAALERDVTGYVQGNCVHCHNGSGVPGASFDMRSEVFVANTVGMPTTGSASAAGLRVVPGDPEASVLYQAFVARQPAAPMPPLGVQRRDQQTAALVHAWIESL